MSSDRPFGALSDSMSVTNPYLYWSTSIRRTRSTVSCTAGILPSAAVSRTAGWIGRLWLVSGSGHPVVQPDRAQAARPCRFLSNAPDSLFQASRKRFDLGFGGGRAEADPHRAARQLRRRPPWRPAHARAATLPDEQAAPDDTATPSRSKAITAVSAFRPGTANSVVLGSRGAVGAEDDDRRRDGLEPGFEPVAQAVWRHAGAAGRCSSSRPAGRGDASARRAEAGDRRDILGAGARAALLAAALDQRVEMQARRA